MSEPENGCKAACSPGASTITRVSPGLRRPDATTTAWAASALTIAAVLLCLDTESAMRNLLDSLLSRGFPAHHSPIPDHLIWGHGSPIWLHAATILIACIFPMLEVCAVVAGAGVLRGWRAAAGGMVICAWATIGVLLLRMVVDPILVLRYWSQTSDSVAAAARALGLASHWNLAWKEYVLLSTGLLLVKTLLELLFCGLLIRQMNRARSLSNHVR